MNQSSQTFELMLAALAELQPELTNNAAKPLPFAPSLQDTLEQIGPQPKEALLLGLASDGLPLLLNLFDARPGPLLVAADPGAGKTALLQCMAQAASLMHAPETLQFGVISNYPDEWQAFTNQPHTLGIFPTYHNRAMEFLRSLSGWAHANNRDRKSILLLIDDLESMEHLDFEIRQLLRWLLLRGPARRVWPILTINAHRIQHIQDWLEPFRTRLFGCIKDDQTSSFLTGIPQNALSQLHPGLQFAIQEEGRWLKFWIPEI